MIWCSNAPAAACCATATFNRRTFGPAAIAIGEPRLTRHGLRHTAYGIRHTAASLAIAAGGNVKVVQQMLGHATASMTLDLYGHLFPDQLDDVADRLDVIGRATADNSADVLRTDVLRIFCGRSMFCGYFADYLPIRGPVDPL
jgi:hypothetical protein